MLHTSPRSRRSGVILLVVVSMLTLFAIVGLSFVMYAESEAKGAALSRDAQSQFRPDLDAEMLASFALGQLLYDVHDDETGVYSALRGHSLARSMYGYNNTPADMGPDPPIPGAVNIMPFTGVGRIRTGLGSPLPGGSLVIQPPGQRQYNNSFNMSDEYFPNYMFFSQDNMLREPERLGPPIFSTGPPALPGEHGFRRNLTEPRGPYTGGVNAPYTYPDLNNMFLAAVKADGTLLMPSFHRPWLFGRLDNIPNQPPGNPGNPFWTNQMGKYLTLRPRPADMGLGFPYAEDATGDVKQLVGAPGGNDSIWIDLGFPPKVTPDGRKYKPLFAFLVVDLDNRINLNVHGNVRGFLPNTPLRAHRSNQGWGPWEVNVGRVLTAQLPLTPPVPGYPVRDEWTNLFGGDNVRGWSGRYGLDPTTYGPYPTVQPNQSATAPSGYTPHFYHQADYDGARLYPDEHKPSDRFRIPGQLGANLFSPFPLFVGATGWDNGTDVSPTQSERRDHPSLYDVMQPRTVGADPALPDRRFGLSNMEALLRYGDTGSPALTSELFQFCPVNFGDESSLAARLASFKRRNLVTVRSYDLDRPGVSPWTYTQPDGLPGYGQAAGWVTGPYRAPVGAPLSFPGLNWRLEAPPTPTNFLAGSKEFKPNDWRWQPVLADALSRVDLNRKLTSYPLPSVPTPETYNFRFDKKDPTNPAAAQLIVDTYLAALRQRQALANDIYNRLLSAVGIPRAVLRPAPPYDPNTDELHIRRWLAQVAVNIVDYLDEDDLSTPFHFYTVDDYKPLPPPDPPFDVPGATIGGDLELPRFWVFGTELPRIVINEVLVETEKDIYATDQPAQLRVFAELHNPFPPGALPPTVQQQDSRPVRLQVDALQTGVTSVSLPATGVEADYAAFVVATTPRLAGPSPFVTDPLPLQQRNENVLGRGDNGPGGWQQATDINDLRSRLFIVGNPNTPFPQAQANERAIGPGQYFLVGPDEPPPPPATSTQRGDDGRGTILSLLPTTKWLRSPQMERPRTPPGSTDPIDERQSGITVSLRRLANPHIPPQNAPSLQVDPTTFIPNPWYNPYVTIDHMDRNPIRPYELPGLIYHSRGKQQPYAAFVKAQIPTPGAVPPTALEHSPVLEQRGGAPNTKHSFGIVNDRPPLNPGNGDPVVPYSWLVHLDRQLVSPMELLHVSAFPPHRLTQQFMTTFDTRSGTYVPAPVPPNQTVRATIFVQTQADSFAPPPSQESTLPSGPWKIEPGSFLLIDPANNPEVVRVVDVNHVKGEITADFRRTHGNTTGGLGSIYPILGQQPNNQRAPWFTPEARLHRFLEFVETGSRAAGVAPGGRIPGKININTVWDVDTFRALCDAQLAQGSNQDPPVPTPGPNHFDTRHVDPLFTLLTASRLPGGAIDVNSRPFHSLAAGLFPAPPTPDLQYPDGLGLNRTFVGSSPVPGGDRLLHLPAGPLSSPDPTLVDVDRPHPYLQEQLLNKIVNNLTTRSNVFAVYLTVGFFEVTDETSRPVKLGAEIGKAENRNVRHRMFAIVDRTNLSIATRVGHTLLPIDPNNPQPSYTVALNTAFNAPPWNNPWNAVQAGSTLIVDVGERQETIAVIGRNGNQISAVFTKPHSARCPISLPSVPGEAPFFLKSVAVTPFVTPPAQNTTNQFWVKVPVQRYQNTPFQLMAGEYDGLEWEIRPGSTSLILGNGAEQELVLVNAIRQLPADNNPANPMAEFLVTLDTTRRDKLDPSRPRQLAEPWTISNTILGNPGPQPRFNPRQQPYSAVVRYLSIID